MGGRGASSALKLAGVTAPCGRSARTIRWVVTMAYFLFLLFGPRAVANGSAFRTRLRGGMGLRCARPGSALPAARTRPRSEEHTSELQSLMRISYAVFCLKK